MRAEITRSSPPATAARPHLDGGQEQQPILKKVTLSGEEAAVLNAKFDLVRRLARQEEEEEQQKLRTQQQKRKKEEEEPEHPDGNKKVRGLYRLWIIPVSAATVLFCSCARKEEGQHHLLLYRFGRGGG